MKRIIPILLLTLCSCSGQDEKIPFEDKTSIKPFINEISSIELIPLETDNDHLLGSSPELILSEKSYIIADKQNCRIFRYSEDGKFLNSIGSKGRANNEYVDIEGLQASGNEVIVFSRPGKMLRFAQNGDFIETKEYKGKGVQSYLAGDDILTYYSYGSGKSYRLALLKAADTLCFLKTKDNVMNFAGDGTVFSSTNKGGIAIIDSYNPDIYEYDAESLKRYLTFDFGKYSIPDKFYKFKDPYQSSQYLFSRNFALIHRYSECKNYKLVEIFLQKDKRVPEFHYGLETGGKWIWFYAGKAGEEPLATSFRLFDENSRLLCVIDPSTMGKLPYEFKKLVRNQEVIEQSNINTNYVIAKITLK